MKGEITSLRDERKKRDEKHVVIPSRKRRSRVRRRKKRTRETEGKREDLKGTHPVA